VELYYFYKLDQQPTLPTNKCKIFDSSEHRSLVWVSVVVMEYPQVTKPICWYCDMPLTIGNILCSGKIFFKWFKD